MKTALVVLSQHDKPPNLSAIATVSKTDSWDDGGYAQGLAAALAGRLWVDRPYWTGDPPIAQLVERARHITQAGGYCQAGNELNNPIERYVHGPDVWKSVWHQLHTLLPTGRWIAMPPSPGIPGWESWITRDAPRHAVHAYGTFEQMRTIVETYLTATLPTTDLYITECNFGPGPAVNIDRNVWATDHLRPFLTWCDTQPRVRMVAYFAWAWNADMPIGTAVDARGTTIPDILAEPRSTPVATLPGIDVSNHQRSIDWLKVADSGRKFAFIKASEDSTYLDPYFPTNWARCKAAGMARGAYHFARPSRSSPAESVKHFQGALKWEAGGGGLDTGDMIVLDIEDELVRPHTLDLSQWVAEWLDLAERALGVRPIIYSAHWYMEPHGLEIESLGKYPLWYASYQATVPPTPNGWNHITFWQYTDKGSVPGVAGNCDLNHFFGSDADLRALGKAATTPPTNHTKIREHLDVLYGTANDLDKAADLLQSAYLANAAAAVRERTLAIKSDLGL